MSLQSFWYEWLELFRELESSQDVETASIAAPFLSVPPKNYDPVSVPSILYVGKATAGHWDREGFLRSSDMKERLLCTTRFLTEEVITREYRSAFWDFALRLSLAAADRHKDEIEPLQNLVWSNVCKIGTVAGNPKGKCYGRQRELAIRTLRAEIYEYRPKLLLFVTGGFGEDIIDEVTTCRTQTQWEKGQTNDFWWRDAVGQMPVILWTGHPERKSLNLLDIWQDQAAALLVGDGKER
jgi:hypothetical protein